MRWRLDDEAVHRTARWTPAAVATPAGLAAGLWDGSRPPLSGVGGTALGSAGQRYRCHRRHIPNVLASSHQAS